MTHLYADDDYLDYYQFEHDPFADCGEGFKFFSAKRQSVLVEMQHIARYSNLMLVVTGPQGSGKTVLRQALAASAEDHVKNIVITASATADAAAMLQQVNIALGLQDNEIADVLRHIEDMLAAGHEVHLIVDNAEFLDESALLFLQRITQGVNDACAHVFVFSDSSICPLLDKVADNSDLHHVIALEPWDKQETVNYIGQQLMAAGQQFDMFTEHQLDDIFTQSQGWPGRINHAAKGLLLEYLHSSGKNTVKKATTNIPYKHLGILAVLIIALLLMWLLQSPDLEPTPEQASIPLSTAQPSQQAGKGDSSAQLPKIQRELSLEPAPATVILAEEAESQPQVQPTAPAVVTAPAAPVSQPQVKVVQPPAPVVKKPVPPVQPPRPAPAPVKPVVVHKPAPKPTPAPAAAASSAAQNQWYKQQTPSRYTLQVLATSSEASARNFVQQNPAQFHYFRKQHQGQALYVVTSGSFIDRAAALIGANSLPESLRKGKPWPRSMLSIQQELR